MRAKIYLFEDPTVERFLPLVWLRPFLDLRIGITTFYEKWINAIGRIDGIVVRPYLAEYSSSLWPDLKVNEVSEGIAIFLNARLNPYSVKVVDLEELKPNEGVKDRWGNIAYFCAKVGEERVEDVRELFKKVSEWRTCEDCNFLAGLEDLIKLNGYFLFEDFRRMYPRVSLKIPSDLRAFGEMIYIHEEAEVWPFVVIDAQEGPVVIEKGAKVFPYVFIKGPAFIGENSVIKPFTKIFENTTIGPVCKVGGEIESSVFHSYSNKQHDGFLGHSYVGQWVNLGADTVTSDLKNNYSNVKLRYVDREWDSGTQFLGSFLGDHVKTGINTMLNTGSIVGVFSNLFGKGYMPKFVPSFSWGGSEGLTLHDLDKAIETAKRMMKRRNATMSKEYEMLVRKVFELSSFEREFLGLSKNS